MQPFLQIDYQPHRGFPRRRKCSTLYLVSLNKNPSHLIVFALSIVLLTVFSACKSAKSPTRIEGELATVIDLTGLDGCQKLLVMDYKDQRMLPTNGAEHLGRFHYGDRVVVQYKEYENAVSICMVEDIGGKIEVIEKAEPLVDLSWIDDRIKPDRHHSVYRCTEEKGDFIYIKSALQSTLYDLKGYEVCSTRGKAMSDCVRRFNASKQCLIKEGQ